MDLHQTAETGATPPLADAEIEQPGDRDRLRWMYPLQERAISSGPHQLHRGFHQDRRLHRWPIEQALIHPSGTGAPGGARPPGRRSTKVTFVRPGVAAGPLLQTFIPVGVSGPGKPSCWGGNASAMPPCAVFSFQHGGRLSHKAHHKSCRRGGMR